MRYPRSSCDRSHKGTNLPMLRCDVLTLTGRLIESLERPYTRDQRIILPTTFPSTAVAALRGGLQRCAP
jgi:hypothetical protein